MLLLTSYTKIAVLPALEISLFQIHQKATFEENNNKITLSSLEVGSLDSHLNLNYKGRKILCCSYYSLSFFPFPKMLCKQERKNPSNSMKSLTKEIYKDAIILGYLAHSTVTCTYVKQRELLSV